MEGYQDHYGFFILAILIVMSGTIVHVAAGTMDAQRVFPENDTAGYVPVDIIIIDPAIKAATPDYNLLVLDAEGKANYLRDLNADFDHLYAGDPEKETRYAALAAKLNAIWDKYPVVSETKPGSAGYPTYGGSGITLRFSPSVTSTNLTDDENAAIRDSAAIMKEAFLKSIGNPADLDSARTPVPDTYPQTFGNNTGWVVVHANVDDATVDFDTDRKGELTQGALIVPVNVTVPRYKTVSVFKLGYISFPVSIDRYPAPGESIDLYATLSVPVTATRPPATQSAPLPATIVIIAIGCTATAIIRQFGGN
ncbi:MAG: hypothetical protein WCX22_00420 [Methanoregula sp.]